MFRLGMMQRGRFIEPSVLFMGVSSLNLGRAFWRGLFFASVCHRVETFWGARPVLLWAPHGRRKRAPTVRALNWPWPSGPDL